MTVFFRVVDSDVEHKGHDLLASIKDLAQSRVIHSRVFEREPSIFDAVPGTPFAYWVTERLRNVFKEFAPFEDAGRTAKQGLTTSDDFRFLRAWYEVGVDSLDKQAFPFLKGGEYQPFYADIPVVVRWADGGAEMKAWIDVLYGASGSWSRNIRSIDLYFSPGLTWPLRAVGLSMSPVPRGTIFSARGYLATAPEAELLAMLGVMSSRIFEEIFRVCLSGVRPEFIVGVLNTLPFPSVDQAEVLARLAHRAWSLKRSLDTVNETSHAFVLPEWLNVRLTGLDRLAAGSEVGAIQGKIDDEGYRLYKIGSDDRAAIESFSSVRGGGDNEFADGVESELDDAEVERDTLTAAQTDGLTSWLVGVAFGRFDPRLATGERAIPSEPAPFEPLPSRSPGMYPEGEEPAGHCDILVDDQGHADDLAARAQTVTELVRVNAPENLRGWLAKEFFSLHIKMYSKSRRKAPIYWQLATPSASYSVWLYIHAFSKDTLFRVQNDYVAPKLAHEERRLESLTHELRDGGTAAHRKELATQEALVDELRAFLDEVKRVAPLWNPNLDDGVIINFAPLWRLVPQNKSWQKELKSTWDALWQGKYDWAHLAMHLWPERVVPKCAKDRSLAIAHGLEDVFWVEVTGKWEARKTPTGSVDKLVKERSSPAVSSALKSLLDARVASATSTRRRRGAGGDDPAVEILPIPTTVTANAWARPHTQERHEIQAAVLAVLKASGAPIDRRQARLASLLCLEPHLLASMLDKPEKAKWVLAVGGDARKAASASIELTANEWGPAFIELRVRGRLVEEPQQNTYALGIGTEAIVTSGWPDGRAGFVLNVLRRLQATTQMEAIILRLPTKAQQWVAHAA